MAVSPAEVADPGRAALDRMMALSDGVFAIAATLLVFSLTVPVLHGRDIGGRLGDVLRHDLDDIGAYALTFTVLGAFWMGHHRILAGLVRADARLMRLNLFFLGCIAFLPFPTGILARYGGTVQATVAYDLSMVVTGAGSTALALYALGRPSLAPGLRPDTVNYLRLRSLAVPTVFLVSALIALASPLAAKWWWLSFFVIARLLRARYPEARTPTERVFD